MRLYMCSSGSKTRSPGKQFTSSTHTQPPALHHEPGAHYYPRIAASREEDPTAQEATLVATKPYKPKRVTPRRRPRVRQALELRKRGATYRQIADQVGCNIRTAYELVQDGLAETTIDHANELRDLLLAQQDTLLVEAFKIINSADATPQTRVTAQQQALRVMDQRIRLLNLTATSDATGQAEAATLLEQLITQEPTT